MTRAELHVALREVVAIGRRGGYDNDEIAANLARVVRDYARQRAAEELRAAADGWPKPHAAWLEERAAALADDGQP